MAEMAPPTNAHEEGDTDQPIRVSSGLENDDDALTIESESAFLKTMNFEPYDASIALKGDYYTVIHSRTTNRLYGVTAQTKRLNSDLKGITVGDFRKYFSETGHTLAIDTERSFAYVCALDLDCGGCKKRGGVGTPSNEHMTEAAVEEVRLAFEQILTSIISQSAVAGLKAPVRTLLFKREKGINRCGFHIYSDVQMTTSFNALVVAKLKAVISERQSVVIIDTPSLLPLPYSAKRPAEPYIPYLMSHDEEMTDSTVMLSANVYYDVFRYFRMERYSDANEVGKIVASIKSSVDSSFDKLVVRCGEPYKRFCMVRFGKLSRLHRNAGDDSNDESINALQMYLDHLLEAGSKLVDAPEGANIEPGPSKKPRLEGANCRPGSSTGPWREQNKVGVANGSCEDLETLNSLEESVGSDAHDNDNSLCLSKCRPLPDLLEPTEDTEAPESDEEFLSDFTRRYRSKLLTFKRIFNIFHKNSTPLVNDQETDDGEFIGSGSLRADVDASSTVSLNEGSTSSRSEPSLENFDLKELDEFLEISAISDGGMNLQHYLVAFCKCFRSVSFLRVKRFLNLIYADYTRRRSLERLLKMLSSLTVDCYDDSYNYILEYLGIVYKYRFSLNDTIEQRVEKYILSLLESRLRKTFSSGAELSQHLVTLTKKDARDEAERKIISCYIEAISKLRIILVENGIWYMFKEQGYYAKCESIRWLPWIMNYAKLDNTKREIDSKASTKFTIPRMWSQTCFLFDCDVGVFNAITGLYVTKTPFLRFSKQRNYALWDPFKSNYVMDSDQNERLITMLDKASWVVDIFTKRTRDIFLYFRVIPAILELPSLYSVRESDILKFMNILDTYADLTPFTFVIDYFRIKPEFICFTILMYCKDVRFFKSYKDAVKCCFGPLQKIPSVGDWQTYVNTLLQGIEYDKSAKTHESLLNSLRHPKIDSTSYDRDLQIYSTFLAVFIIKSFPTYKPLLEAISPEYLAGCKNSNFARGPKPKIYEKATKSNGRYNNEALLKLTIRQIFGSELKSFDLLLIKTGFLLCMSVNFNEKTLRELLMSVSFTFTTRNLLKKVIVFFGDQGTGKSLVSDLIQEMCMGSVTRVHDLRDANNRANLSVRSNVVLINEVKVMDPNMLKAISGGDPESCKMFFKQEYELLSVQAIIFGATNAFIILRHAHDPRSPVDRVTVDRLHVIVFRGMQYFEHDTENSTDSAFSDLIEGKFECGALPINKVEMGSALAWLSFAAYFNGRDSAFRPILDVSNNDVLRYQQQVYILNNALYAFIYKCGIIEAANFCIDKTTFLQKIKTGIDEKTTVVNNLSDFIAQFKQQFNIDLNDGSETVEKYHLRGFVKHVQDELEVVIDNESIIDQELFEEKLKAFSGDTDQENARRYFVRRWKKYYDQNLRLWSGIRFVNESINQYPGNKVSAGMIDGDTLSVISTPVQKSKEAHEKDNAPVSSSTPSYHIVPMQEIAG